MSSAAINIILTQRHAGQVARAQARSMFEHIVLTRSWNARHGGVYVPITDSTQPNPYLKVPERDVVTQQGVKLTKINPAYGKPPNEQLSLLVTTLDSDMSYAMEIVVQMIEAYEGSEYQADLASLSERMASFDGDAVVELSRLINDRLLQNNSDIPGSNGDGRSL